MKEKLIEILKNPADKLIAIDLDGTLCSGKFWKEECEPIKDIIDLTNGLYKKGAHIIIWTARFPEHASKTFEWLGKNKVLYHGVSMHTKIGADLYIDDKSLNVEDFKSSLI